MRTNFTAIATGIAFTLLSTTVNAAYIINIDQVGSDVFAKGSGSLDVSDLQKQGSGFNKPYVSPSNGSLKLGPFETEETFYTGSVTGSGLFGSGSVITADSATGDSFRFDIGENGLVAVPLGYKSGDSLTSSATFLNTSISALGLTSGTYTYTVAPNVEEQFSALVEGGCIDPNTITVNIGPSITPMPLPASAPMFGAGLLGLAGLGYVAKRRKTAAAA